MKALYKSIILFLAAALMFTGCSGVTEKSDAPKTYKVSGKIIVDGAVPEYMVKTNSSNNADRTAIVSFEDVEWDICAYRKYNGNVEYSIFENCEVDGDSFTVNLSSGDWRIEVYDSGHSYLSGYTDITIEDENRSGISVTVETVKDSSECGDVYLTFYEEDGLEIKSVAAEWEDDTVNEWLEGNNELTAYFNGETDASATLSMNAIPDGEYLVTFTFKDANDVTVYACKEVINVLPGAITDTWVGNSPYITSEGKFLLTQDILNSFGCIAPDYSPTNTPYVLYSKNTEKNGITSLVGMQIFDAVDSDSTITNETQGFADFCFADDSIWALFIPKDGQNKDNYSAATLRKYTQTYSGSYIAKDYSIASLINSCAFIHSSSGDVDIVKITHALSYYNGIVYFICELNIDGENDDFIFGVDPETGIISQYFIKGASEFNCTSAENFVFDDGILYYSKGNTIYKISYNIDGELIRFVYDTSHIYPLASQELGFYIKEFAEPQVGDLQIIDDTLYALVYAYAEEQTYFVEGEGQSCDVFLSACVSNGGVMKFDISNKEADIALSKWNNGETTILGWYLQPGSAGQSFFEDVNGANTIDDNYLPLVTQPPLDQTDEIYFFGARKFISTKPGVLVIADDGGYVTDPGSKTATGKSRVVTVNLDDESMSAIDVDVTYSTLADPGATTFYFRD